jgi:hypothetical protein
MYANFVAKNPRAYVGGKARTVAFWGGGYIEPYAARAHDPVDRDARDPP